MLSKTPKYRAAYWIKWRLKNLPYKPKRSSITVCVFCGGNYSRRRIAQKFCSRQCHNKSLKGKIPIGFIGNRGTKPRTYHLRHRDKHGCAADRDWRIAIFKRDNFVCQECKIKGGRLEAHHIKSYKKYPELRHELSNGVTLCKPCHAKTDTYGWANYWKNEVAVKRLSQEVLPL